MERGNEFEQEAQYNAAEREEELAMANDTKADPENLPGELYMAMHSAVKVINICDLMDVLIPGWSMATEDGAAQYRKAGEVVMGWVRAHGAHYYAADREDFSMTKAAFEAERAGKKVVVVEDLS